MNDLNAFWQRVADGLNGRGFRFRIKWSGDDKMANWQAWVICPVPGYLESGGGPVPVRDVEWLDIATSDRNGRDQRRDIVAVLTALGVDFQEVPNSIRVMPEVV